MPVLVVSTIVAGGEAGSLLDPVIAQPPLVSTSAAAHAALKKNDCTLNPNRKINCPRRNVPN
jgi:hypothetical protein